MKARSTSVQTAVAQRRDAASDASAGSAQLIEQRTRALLDLVEADRARQCAQILAEAQAKAAALRDQAHAEARARMRQAFAEQRLLQRERIAAAQARLATRRRVSGQQRTAALLRLAWEQLPDELLTLWRDPGARAAWVTHVVAAAREHMPAGGWRIVHATDWPAVERQAFAAALEAQVGQAPLLEPSAAIDGGLKVVADGNVIDGTLAGLLADRADVEARLLRHLEPLDETTPTLTLFAAPQGGASVPWGGPAVLR